VALTLRIGQQAIYPSRGIAQVVSVEKREIGGKVQNFYVLRWPVPISKSWFTSTRRAGRHPAGCGCPGGGRGPANPA